MLDLCDYICTEYLTFLPIFDLVYGNAVKKSYFDGETYCLLVLPTLFCFQENKIIITYFIIL